MDKKKIFARVGFGVGISLLFLVFISALLSEESEARARCNDLTLEWVSKAEQQRGSAFHVEQRAYEYDFYYTTCMRQKGYEPQIGTHPSQ
jgi:hypothetical protein